MFKTIKNIHLIGIGGSGMSGIAEVLLKLGYKVTGSDLTKTAVSRRLEELGATVWEGHTARNIDGSHVVVTSTAVSARNPEVVEAHKSGIPVIPRIEMLAELARLKYTIAVGGTHGKTTTTSLIGYVLQYNDMDPTIIVGGRLKAVGTGGILGRGDFMVAEADESDGSFLKLSPTISVITNIDDDHLDYWRTEAKLKEAFIKFAGNVPFYGLTFLCGEDAGVGKILPLSKRRYETYGFKKKWDWRADKIETSEMGSSFEVFYKTQNLGRLRIPLAGRHNVLNSLAAVAVATKIGLTFDQISQALVRFDGVGRRFEIKGVANDVTVMDDYGHHPTEIKATLEAVREKWPKKRMVVVFQPHRASRTRLLHKQFAAALARADRLILLPIYLAGEKPVAGVTSHLVAKHLKKEICTVETDEAALLHRLQTELQPGDVLLTLGAGDVWKTGEKYLQSSDSLPSKICRIMPHVGRRLKREEPLLRHSTWAIGGPAEVYIEVHNLAELRGVVSVCQRESKPILLLGWGSNVLLPDEGLRGCVVRLRGDFEKVEFHGTTLRVGGGVHLPRLAKMCAERDLAGMEGMAGVPGTVGAAFMTNAGTPRGVIGDVVDSVDVFESDGSIQTIPKEDIQLGYRTSNLLGKWIVSAVLNLQSAPKGAVANKIKDELAGRAHTQPLGTKNVGSVFKNPPDDYAARLIEAVGLKGKEFGPLRFSPRHANFMENKGGATALDVLNLISLAQKQVKERFGVDLEPEVKVVSQLDLVHHA